ncbi:MAG: UDP-N-acetylmuramoyl-tripeptide--D-alanyl-D-alanine ligase [Patescibacteria group bacterium]|jgi:UDP-N-acetylmuramoyl-tripeptide--D-alanyl-D-alanine ligase|nr:UDP-N-acetylmuramoyl-tripeptide--D-alanyl-D-alanine ligase [Patescibacteria group bacterium]
MKKILQLKLKILAKLVIWRQKPKVVAITGSVGKTSSKNVICQVLKSKYRVSGGLKNYNNEIGLPLSIIGQISPGKNIFAWLAVFCKAIILIIFKSKKYPKILVLEMGIDRPGDMDYLCSIAMPSIGVVTSVGHSHIEFFGSRQKIKEEKQKLVKALPANGLAILNCDDDLVCQMANLSRSKVLKYGFNSGAELKAQDLKYNLERGNYDLSGLNFKFNYNGSIVPVVMDNVITKSAVYAALSAASVGLHFGLNLIDIAASLKDFSLPNGRMNTLIGINHSFIIDDSYNSSPESCKLALEVFNKIKIDNESFKYAVLGDILELGDMSIEIHREIGKYINNLDIDFLVLVGKESEYIGEEANRRGFAKKNIFSFENSSQAGLFIQDRIRPGDVMLFKGSRGMKMEEGIKKVMINPEKSDKLLVK